MYVIIFIKQIIYILLLRNKMIFNIEKPKNFEKMLTLTERLSKNFDYVLKVLF